MKLFNEVFIFWLILIELVHIFSSQFVKVNVGFAKPQRVWTDFHLVWRIISVFFHLFVTLTYKGKKTYLTIAAFLVYTFRSWERVLLKNESCSKIFAFQIERVSKWRGISSKLNVDRVLQNECIRSRMNALKNET